MVYHVYILKCSDGTYYTGHSDQLGKRLAEHHNQVFSDCYTATRLPVELVFQQPFATQQGAIANQQQISSWSQAKLEAFLAQGEQLVSDVPKPQFIAHT
ncbi:GIY-YIG nuclease family protein [Oceaniserpentilla sp. 4NH20-0058]|uniref:GIY-YIG nuclease family protein n=1 Tax=Oceaniserpentilla sp. 4NH20-0058 TaxID=3127660 RepID=UPI003102671C